MLSFEQFKTLIHNLIRLYKSGCMMQNVQSIKNPLLSNIEKTIPILLSEAYGNVIANEIVDYIKEDSEYSIEELYNSLDEFSKMISKDSAMTLWKLNELYPNNDMISYFMSITNARR